MNAASPAWLPCWIISRYGPESSGNGRCCSSTVPAVSIISIFTFSPRSDSSFWMTWMASSIFGNCAVRPIRRISGDRSTPSALASSSSDLAFSGSYGQGSSASS